MNHHPRRARSPSFGYDPRMMTNNRTDYDDPYHPANQFIGPPQPPPPGGPPPFMDQLPHHNYPVNYRDHQRLPSTYRATLSQRELYPISGPPPPRAGSPPYKILCITNINPKIGDGPVKDALTSDYSRFGDISVSICHDSGERLAYIYFRNYEEAREARHTKTRTLFFDRPVEIEPIYEPPGGANGSSIDASPPSTMVPPVPQIYSPRRRSMTPPDYPHDFNDPMVHRGQLPPPHLQHPHGPPAPPIHGRCMSPTDYPPPLPHSGGYPHGPSPPGPALLSHDRRGSYGGNGSGYGYLPTHVPHSPYSSPPHEQYRSYPPHNPSSHHNFDPASNLPYPSGPYVGPPHHSSRGERERLLHESTHFGSRSPRSDFYYQIEQRGGFPPPALPTHHSSSRSLLHSSSHYAPHPSLSPNIHQTHHQSSSTYRSPPPPTGPDHHPVDPPARYMSREFRREKFGSEHYNSEHDDGRPSRVLLVNNIDSTKTETDLRDIFETFGIIEEMEVKQVASEISSALIKFSSMDGAYKAKTANNGRYIGGSRCRIVYGKVSASRRLWIGGLSPATTVPCLEDECSKFGDVVSMDYTSGRPYAYVEYESANQAQFAAHHLRTTLTPASERKIRIEFVDPDRSEKLMPRNDSSAQIYIGSKSRNTTESCGAGELDRSPQITGGRKRSLTPTELSGTKRSCQANDLPLGANTFKQERLAAAAAAKARTSSSTSSSASHHHLTDEGDKIRSIEERNELNNNSDDNRAGNGNIVNQQQIDDGAQKEVPSVERLSQCTSIREIVQCCSVSWFNQLALRNFIFPSRIFLCSGRKQSIDRYLKKPNSESGNGVDRCPILRITQRWRLHPQPKLEEVKRRMQSGNLGMLIITARPDNELPDERAQQQTNATTTEQMAPVGSNQENDQRQQERNHTSDKSAVGNAPQIPSLLGKTDSNFAECLRDNLTSAATVATNNMTPNQTTQSRPLRNLISYLEQKDAAGVISLSALDGAGANDQTAAGSDGNSKLLYAFPPGDFALNLIKRKASNLTSEATKEEFLLGVIVGGNEAKI